MKRSLVVLVLLAACGDSIDLGDYRQAGIDARCEYLTRCGLWTTVAACQEYYERITLDNPNPQAAVDAGKLQYDGDAARTCFDALESAACTRTADTNDACTHVFTGTIPDGGMCAFDAECVSAHCVVPDCTMACCQGACAPPRPLPGIGQACTFECVEGAYCAADSTCHSVLPQGAACNDPLACDADLYCAGIDTGSSGVCSALPKTGEPCTSICADIGDRCTAMTCVPLGLPGDPCSDDGQCSFYYRCDTTAMKCAERPMDPLVPNGSTCTSGTLCQSTYCDSIYHVCADVPVCI